MEASYLDYVKQVEYLLSEKTIREITNQVKTLGKFKKNNVGEWEPIRYEGYTLITPTFLDDQENVSCYRIINDARETLLNEVGLAQFVPAPASAFHMTIARLISDDIYETRLKNTRDEEFFLALHEVFDKIARLGPLKFAIKGLSIFPQGVVAAMVSPVTDGDYQRLQSLRDSIYSDKVVTELGVDRKHGFNGHISLLYLEEELSGEDREILAEAVIGINKRFFQTPLTFYISRAEVRKFNHFLRFYREDSWPVYVL